MQPAVHKASTVLFANTAALRARTWKDKTGYTYGLHGTPTTFILEERIATLEGGLQTLLVPSGLAAITLVDMRAAEERRRGADSRQRLRSRARSWRATSWRAGASRIASTTRWSPRRWPRRMSPATRLVWLEAPGSVTMEFPDLPALLAGRARAPARWSRSTTPGAPASPSTPFALGGEGEPLGGVDISVQALTKYPSGGADLLMGSVTTRDEALHQRLKATHMRMGWGVGGNDVEAGAALAAVADVALSRRRTAPAASSRPMVVDARRGRRACCIRRCPGSPGHAHWARSAARPPACSRSSSMPRFASAQVDAFVDALKLFRIGYSWAGPVSLVVPYDLSTDAPAPRPASRGTVVRFSIGLEAVEDLIADCEQALPALAAALRRRQPRDAQPHRQRDRVHRERHPLVGLAAVGACRPCSISKRPISVASAIFISSIARCRPGQTRGPAPNGIETRFAEVALGPALGRRSQRCGSNAAASAK